MRVLIVEDHPMVVDGWLLQFKYLAPECRLQHATDWTRAKKILSHERQVRRGFDWVILDVDLSEPGSALSPAMLKERILACAPSQVWVCTALDDPLLQQACQAAGAQWLPKSIHTQEWQQLIRAQLQALRARSEKARGSGLGEATKVQAQEASPDPIFRLTARQLQVLTHAAQGLRSSEIAQRLNVSEETIRSHLQDIYRLLGVHNRTQACQHYWLWQTRQPR